MDNLTLTVLKALLSKRGWFGLHHLVQHDTFMISEARLIYKALARMHDTSEHDISPEALKADIEVTYQKRPEQREGLLALAELIDETPDLPEDQVQSLVKRFLELSNSHKIVEYIANNADQESFDATVVEELVARAVEVTGRVNTTIVDIFETSISGSSDTRPVRHGLGISRELDSSLRGGIGPGELGIYLAAPSVGKTSFLCKSGASHALAGGGVLHITLEINTRKVIERYDQAWSGLSSETLQTPEGQATATLCREIVQKNGGQVHIVDWSYMAVTANDVGSLVRKLRVQGKKITMVLIDYLGLMSPNKNPGREYRQQFSAVGKEMRALARNLDLPVYTGWQVNREGAKKDTELLSKYDVSESWDIIMIADQILGLNQTQAQLQLRRMVVNIIKQRESTDRSSFTLYCDLDRMVVRDVRKQDDDEAIAEMVASQPVVFRYSGESSGAGKDSADAGPEV